MLVLKTSSLAEQSADAEGGAAPIAGGSGGGVSGRSGDATGAAADGSAAAPAAKPASSAAKPAKEVLGHHHLVRVVVHGANHLSWFSCGTYRNLSV